MDGSTDARSLIVEVPQDLEFELGQVAVRLGVTAAEVLLGCWACVIARWTSQESVLLAANDVCLRFDFAGDPCFEALLQQAVPEQAAHAQFAIASRTEERRTLLSIECLDYAHDALALQQASRAWSVLLGGVIADPQTPVSRLPLLTAEEREWVLRECSGSVRSPDLRLMHELFEEQVERSPAAHAVKDEHQVLTYAELNIRANRLARVLRKQGVGRDQIVGVCLERSVDLIVAILGVLKAGGAYLPLDPAYPASRLAFMLEDAAPCVVVTRTHLQPLLPRHDRLLFLDAPDDGRDPEADQNISAREIGLSARDLAYVIYTSGSTGQPKGALNEHRGMVNRLLAQRDIEAFSERDICCQKTSISFVDAIFEIFGALCNGVPLVVVPDAAATNPEELGALIARERITRLITVPSLAFSMLCSPDIMRNLQQLVTWTLSGEEVRADLLVRLQQQLPRCEFINQYGSSEVSSDASCYRTAHFEGSCVPIGRPVPNVRIYVLDTAGEPVPPGAIGEICVGGAGVGRGYLNRSELTRARFVHDPFCDDPDARMYRMGDLGRWRPDGLLEYLGRNDHQVKIRGFRIEPAEIEMQLSRLPQVRDAAVIAREEVPEQKYLAAYLTLRDERDLVSPDALRADLRTMLPDYMVPAAFVVLKSLPRTPSGKLDRRALPMPEAEAYTNRPFEEPVGEAEKLLASVWSRILGTDRVGRHDNFFELGGHSLLIVRMMQELRSAGISMDARSIYGSASLADLARAVARERIGHAEPVSAAGIPADVKQITPEMLTLADLGQQHIDDIVRRVPEGAANVQDIYPLTPLQEGMLFHHLLHGDQSGDTYVEATLFSLPSRERVEELIAALQFVIDRHDILRTAVLWERLPKPVQVVYREATLPVEEIDLHGEKDEQSVLADWLDPEKQRMNLRQAPLLRLQVAMTSRGQWYALLQMHHMVDDATSLKILISEVGAYLNGKAEQLEAPGAYRDYVVQALAQARAEDSEAFFRRKLGDVSETTAPFGLVDVHGEGSRIEEETWTVDTDLSRRIRVQARRSRVSVATVFHAAWALVVAATSGRSDVVFGSVLLGRLQADMGVKPIVGMFVNTLPVRLRLNDLSARELVERAHGELIDLLSHEQASLVMAQRCCSIAGSAPLFTAVLNYRHGGVDAGAEWERASGVQVLANRERTNYPMTVSIDDLGEHFTATVQTERRVRPARVVGCLHTALQSLLDALEKEPWREALRLPVLPPAEREQVIRAFNATERPYPQDKLIHTLFEEQVARAPDAVAVQYEGERLSYAALNERANRLAAFLREQGVRHGEYVPILMPRSLDMLVAQLAVLKCGGAYVPIDPGLPAERQVFMIRDSGAARVLALGGPDAAMAQLRVLWIDCTEACEAIRAQSAANIPNEAPPPAAYVMYTSGSTGAPKGVIVTHRGVIRLAINNGYARIEPSDCLTHSSNPAFDASTFEVWGALLNGAKLVIVPHSILVDGRRLAQLVRQEGVTILWMTTGLFVQYTEVLADVLPQLRYLLVGGEVLEPAAVQRVLRSGPPQHFLNAYGPTECTTFTTVWAIPATDNDGPIPIGHPIANTTVYVLNRDGQPVPAGTTGEIYIGGDGVALGYLNRADLTRERFVPDPFSPRAGARMYRTGDLGRWRADGAVDFLGRNDEQVKIRGFRIEPGEIEAQLARHPRVKEAVVLVREDEPGDKRLVAYLVGDRRAAGGATADEEPETLRKEIVSEWETLYEQTYGMDGSAKGPSFVGWMSSYTGLPIPEAEMLEWQSATLARIGELNPRRVLEIGCGVGLLLEHLAPRCSVYVGTDFSAPAIETLRRWIARRPDLGHVQLHTREALCFDDLEPGSFDTIVLNSVVQYFPDIDYLVAVLRGAVTLLAPGGTIFVGDVRHLGTLPLFHGAVQLGKAAATLNVGQLRKRIARAVAQDKELVIDPRFFEALPGRVPGITSAEAQVKRGHAWNELTRHRYDVVIGTSADAAPRAVPEQLQWPKTGGSLSEFADALRTCGWRGIQLCGVPNARLGREVTARELIEASEDAVEAGVLRRRLQDGDASGVDPQALWDVADELDYDVTIRPGDDGYFDARLVSRASVAELPRVQMRSAVAEPWSTFANDPLEYGFRQQLIPRVRQYLKGRLPDYMIPSAWMALKQLPLTPNGKVDRRALPAPDGRPEEMGEYVAPRTDLERTLADIWAQILRVDQVGVYDNFFELGGHSLLATRVMTRMSHVLEMHLPVRLIFDKPTIEGLADKVVEALASELQMAEAQ